MARFRDRIRRLKRRLTGNAVLIQQQDGTTVAFTRSEVDKAVFLLRLSRMRGQPEPDHPVLEALKGAPPGERERLEALTAGGAFFEALDDPDFEPMQEVPELFEK